jgi:hypothetical protein
MSKCNCNWCKRFKQFKRVMANPNLTAFEKKFIDKLFDDLMHVEDDLNYKECILEGDWPSAVEQLELALARAKNKRIATGVGGESV